LYVSCFTKSNLKSFFAFSGVSNTPVVTGSRREIDKPRRLKRSDLLPLVKQFAR
jgi:hypothetical protein